MKFSITGRYYPHPTHPPNPFNLRNVRAKTNLFEKHKQEIYKES
jgi:hypothetical protein